MGKRGRNATAYAGLVALLISSFFLPRMVFLSPSHPDVVAAASTKAMAPAMVSRVGRSDVFYVMASSGCGTPSCARLFRTNINMTSFTRVTLPPVARERGGIANTTLDHLVFANREDGFATTGSYSPSTLYVTTNGARSWRRVVHGKDLTIIVSVSASDVFVTTRSCIPRTEDCGQYTTRRASLDARHWVNIPRLWQTGTKRNEVFYGPSVATLADNVWEVENANNRVIVWRSDNRGRTFSHVSEPFPVLVSVAGCSITPISLASLWAECPTGMQVSFWHSSDGGLKWTAVPTTQFMGTGGGAFDPLSANVAYLDYGAILKGPDLFQVTGGGLHETAVGKESCPDVLTLDFVDASHGLKLCGQYPVTFLDRTDNGGVTWTMVALPRAGG